MREPIPLDLTDTEPSGNVVDPVECEECFALISAHRVAAHAYWHELLTERLRDNG